MLPRGPRGTRAWHQGVLGDDVVTICRQLGAIDVTTDVTTGAILDVVRGRRPSRVPRQLGLQPIITTWSRPRYAVTAVREPAENLAVFSATLLSHLAPVPAKVL